MARNEYFLFVFRSADYPLLTINIEAMHRDNAFLALWNLMGPRARSFYLYEQRSLVA